MSSAKRRPYCFGLNVSKRKYCVYATFQYDTSVFGKLCVWWVCILCNKYIFFNLFTSLLNILFMLYTQHWLVIFYLLVPVLKHVNLIWPSLISALQRRHNGRDGVSNHQPYDCLLNRLFRRRSKKTSKLRVTGLCAGNSPVTGEFPAQMASNAENVSIWWRHHGSGRHRGRYVKDN